MFMMLMQLPAKQHRKTTAVVISIINPKKHLYYNEESSVILVRFTSELDLPRN